MGRALSFLAREIQWGKVAGIAAGAAVVSMLLSSGDLSVLSLLTFSLGGILVERAAPRHPYWNALFFGLCGIFFMLVLAQLVQLGTNQPLLTAVEVGWGVLSLSLYTMPQALMGAWIGVTIRRAGEMARQKQEKKEKKAEMEREAQKGGEEKVAGDAGGRARGGRGGKQPQPVPAGRRQGVKAGTPPARRQEGRGRAAPQPGARGGRPAGQKQVPRREGKRQR